MEDLHNAHYTYNDLKPDNMMLSCNCPDEVVLTLIDFGYASKYKNRSAHIEEGT